MWNLIYSHCVELGKMSQTWMNSKKYRVHDLDPLKSYQQNPQFFSMLKLKNPAQHQV
jgi:hypothetical protein